MSAPANLESTFVVIKPEFHAESISVTETIYEELDKRFDGFKNHSLISSHRCNNDWPTWEMHPNGDEIVCLISGDVEFSLRNGDGERQFRLRSPGDFVVVPKGVWHTAHVKKSAQLMFVTPGEGTEHRESPPV